jgi:ABC-2 type transport system permease protein
MNDSPVTPPIISSAAQVRSPEQALRRLFLTLFLRGRSSRGLNKAYAPKSVASKLTLILLIYLFIGMAAFGLQSQGVFVMSLFLHAMTLGFLGMFVASSAGEILFNKQEADILLHRPVSPRAMLWAKIAVLVQISLWLAGAFNLASFIAGINAPDGGWLYPLAHAISTTLQALFCTGCVVLSYQLCLRWFGRERLEGIMTAVQVLVAVAAMLGGQIIPRLVIGLEKHVRFDASSWWLGFLPPTWFAGFDDAIAGGGAVGSWVLAALAVLVTGVVLWLAFDKLAQDYETGLQALNDVGSGNAKADSKRSRWCSVFVNSRLMRWWMPDSVSRASFLLTIAYLFRDREMKLRLYPGLAPMLILPFIMFFKGGVPRDGGFGTAFSVAFSGSFLGLIPMLALDLIRYSQQWQAADLFRAAPIRGPMPICNGARVAVLVVLTFPLLAFVMAGLLVARVELSLLTMLLPGLIAMPVYSLVPCFKGRAVPLSHPSEEGKAAGRGLTMIGVMIVSTLLAAAGAAGWKFGFLWPFLAFEVIVVSILYFVMRRSLNKLRWPSLE